MACSPFRAPAVGQWHPGIIQLLPIPRHTHILDLHTHSHPTPIPAAVPSEDLARFEVTEAERAFRGDPDDRKAMLEHRQALQARVKALDAEKKAHIAAVRAAAEQEAKGANKAVRVRATEKEWSGGWK